MATPTEIIKPIILLVEGYDEENFFRYYIKFLKQTNPVRYANLEDIQIICYEGISKLEICLKTIQVVTGSEAIQKIGIIRDAEDDAIASFATTQSNLRQANLEIPQQQLILTRGNPRIVVMIVPEQGSGSIEITFLESVNHDPAFHCVNQYINCLNPLYESNVLVKSKNIHKTKLHAFLASRKEPNISIGGAAQNGYWNYNNPAFNRIKKFLEILIN